MRRDGVCNSCNEFSVDVAVWMPISLWTRALWNKGFSLMSTRDEYPLSGLLCGGSEELWQIVFYIYIL